MESALSLKTVSPNELFIDKLPPAARRAFLGLAGMSLLEQTGWYLGGGTALALQVGHRRSVDLDFFTPEKNFSETSMERQLLVTDSWKTTLREAGTIYGEFMNAKVSFIAYPFFIPSPERIICGAIRLLVPADIAVMKIIAVSQRGRKRDFIDLFWYCRNREKLVDVVRRVPRHYPKQKHNLTHFLKSLTYFADAELEPMPELFFKTDWRAVKKFFQVETPGVAKQLLNFP